MKKHSLDIKNLHVTVEDTHILKGVSLAVDSGEVHAIMGPNGSGKSTLAYTLMGHPAYKISNSTCQIKIDNEDIISLPTEDRAKAGLFLAMQAPIAIPGVSINNFLRTAYQAIHTHSSVTPSLPRIQNPVLTRQWSVSGLTLVAFIKQVKECMSKLKIDESFLQRSIHDGFSGGEKKKLEMLQALVLAPKFAIFDEIDTGLDVDALKLVGTGMQLLQKQGVGILVITHYQRILRYVKPNFVHVMVNGRIVEDGTASLAKRIEKEGYRTYAKKNN